MRVCMRTGLNTILYGGIRKLQAQNKDNVRGNGILSVINMPSRSSKCSEFSSISVKFAVFLMGLNTCHNLADITNPLLDPHYYTQPKSNLQCPQSLVNVF